MPFRLFPLTVIVLILFSTPAGASEIATLLWDVNDKSPLSVIVSEVLEKEVHIRTIKIRYQDAIIFSFSDPDHFLGMFPTSDTGGRLVTIWVSGSGYKLRVFSGTVNNISLDLEAGSKTIPEFLLSNSGPAFVVTDVGGNSQVYKWNGLKYIASDFDRKKLLGLMQGKSEPRSTGEENRSLR